MHVKICGITSLEDALVAAQAGADFIGLILADSPRRVALDEVRRIHALVGERPSPVLVFRDARPDEVIAALDHTGCVWVQLHGRETPADLAALRSRNPLLRTIKAFELTGSTRASDILEYAAAARRAGALPDVLLLDAPKAGPAPKPQQFIELAAQLRPRPAAIWRAGGLTPESVGEVITSGLFDGVDVASGVESAPGRKSVERVRQFIAAARA